MAKKPTITPLARKFNALPYPDRKSVLAGLQQNSIIRSTFYRDLKTSPGNIPSGRLQTYAALLNCEVGDLMDDFSKGIKPAVGRKSVGASLGLQKS